MDQKKVEILIKALKEIEQFSDVGNDWDAVIRMKEIASLALEQVKK